MSTRSDGSGRLFVGPLAFDPDSGELTGPAGVQRVAPQPGALFTLLASRPGEVVTRDEVREHLWPGGKVEFEQGIAFAIREVRKAIEAAGGDPASLETIPKRGFRLRVGGAGIPTQPAEPPVPGPTDPADTIVPAPSDRPDRFEPRGEAQTPRPARAETWRALVRPLVIVGIVGAIGLAALIRGAPPPSLPAVALFVHDTEADAHAQLARAIGFELTTALTWAFEGQLSVVGPTGTATLSGPNDTEGARAALGACLVVSGGVRAVSADTVVVFTQVVRTLDRAHAWAAQDTVPLEVGAARVVPRVVEGVRLAAAAC